MKADAANNKNRIYLYLLSHKIATLDELKKELNTQSTMTVFRRLKELNYISSYSHRGKYYSLKKLAEFDNSGLWSCRSVHFSKYGNMIDTANSFIDRSKSGYSAKELKKNLHVEVKHALLKLSKETRVYRKKIEGIYIYFTLDKKKQKSQILLRNKKLSTNIVVSPNYDPVNRPDELKAAIILFFSLLDEQQRRLFAGLESYKHGYGGDSIIAGLLGVDAHTVAKGRKDLLAGKINTISLRKKGAGRKQVEKKFPK